MIFNVFNAYNKRISEFGLFEILHLFFIPVCVLLPVFIWDLEYCYCILTSRYQKKPFYLIWHEKMHVILYKSLLMLFLYSVCIFVTIIIIKKNFVNFDYCFVCSKENTFNILTSSKPTKVYEEHYLSSALSFMIYMYNSGKVQLIIEKFIRISGHQMSTRSSSLAACLAWMPFDNVH
jgi:hypothetical protein